MSYDDILSESSISSLDVDAVTQLNLLNTVVFRSSFKNGEFMSERKHYIFVAEADFNMFVASDSEKEYISPEKNYGD
jgi:hypothetical protein